MFRSRRNRVHPKDAALCCFHIGRCQPDQSATEFLGRTSFRPPRQYSGGRCLQSPLLIS
jgi:hypothetical protein